MAHLSAPIHTIMQVSPNERRHNRANAEPQGRFLINERIPSWRSALATRSRAPSRPSRKAPSTPSPSSRRPTSWSLSTSDSSARARCARRLESLKPLWVGALLLLGDFCLFIWDSHSLWSPCPATRVLPPRQTRTLKLRRIRESRALRRRLGRWPPWLC